MLQIFINCTPHINFFPEHIKIANKTELYFESLKDDFELRFSLVVLCGSSQKWIAYNAILIGKFSIAFEPAMACRFGIPQGSGKKLIVKNVEPLRHVFRDTRFNY